jgi:TRAP-type mannitol/chloroaromatic compound transport system permease large subunit
MLIISGYPLLHTLQKQSPCLVALYHLCLPLKDNIFPVFSSNSTAYKTTKSTLCIQVTTIPSSFFYSTFMEICPDLFLQCNLNYSANVPVGAFNFLIFCLPLALCLSFCLSVFPVKFLFLYLLSVTHFFHFTVCHIKHVYFSMCLSILQCSVYDQNFL